MRGSSIFHLPACSQEKLGKLEKPAGKTAGLPNFETRLLCGVRNRRGA